MEPVIIVYFVMSGWHAVIGGAAFYQIFLRYLDQMNESVLQKVTVRIVFVHSLMASTSFASIGFVLSADESQRTDERLYQILRVVYDAAYDFGVLVACVGLYVYVYETVRSARMAVLLHAFDGLVRSLRNLIIFLFCLNVCGYFTSTIGRPLFNRLVWSAPWAITLLVGGVCGFILLVFFFYQLRATNQLLRSRQSSVTSSFSDRRPASNSIGSPTSSIKSVVSADARQPTQPSITSPTRPSLASQPSLTSQPSLSRSTSFTDDFDSDPFCRYQSCVGFLSLVLLCAFTVLTLRVYSWLYYAKTQVYFGSSVGWDPLAMVAPPAAAVAVYHWWKPYSPRSVTLTRKPQLERQSSRRNSNLLKDQSVMWQGQVGGVAGGAMFAKEEGKSQPEEESRAKNEEQTENQEEKQAGSENQGAKEEEFGENEDEPPPPIIEKFDQSVSNPQIDIAIVRE